MKTLVPWLTLSILLGFPGLAIAEHQNHPRHGSHSKICRQHGPSRAGYLLMGIG